MLFILHAAKDIHIAFLFLRQCGILEYEGVWCPGRGEYLGCGQVLRYEKLPNGRHQWRFGATNSRITRSIRAGNAFFHYKHRSGRSIALLGSS